MKKTSKRRWIVTLLTGVVALIVVVRRRLQPIESRPLLPPPPLPPSEPPRIVLPTEIINASGGVPESKVEKSAVTHLPSEAEAVAAETAPEQETEAPLLEREVGGTSVALKPAPQTQAVQLDSEREHTDDEDPLLSYCVSCRTKRPMVNTHEETTENGRRALRGTCEVCGANMFRFLPNQDKSEE